MPLWFHAENPASAGFSLPLAGNPVNRRPAAGTGRAGPVGSPGSQATKPGRGRALSAAQPEGQGGNAGSGGLEGLDAVVQAALVASSLVLVDQATRAEAIQDRLGNGEGGFGAGASLASSALITFLTAVRHRALSHVARVAHDGLLARFLADLILATVVVS